MTDLLLLIGVIGRPAILRIRWQLRGKKAEKKFVSQKKLKGAG